MDPSLRSAMRRRENIRGNVRVRQRVAPARRHPARRATGLQDIRHAGSRARQRHPLSDELRRAAHGHRVAGLPEGCSTRRGTSSSFPTCSATGCRPRRRTRPGSIPSVTTYDNVMQQRRCCPNCSASRACSGLRLVDGRQQAYHWAALFPDAVERIVVNCGSAKRRRTTRLPRRRAHGGAGGADTGGGPARHGPHLCRLGAEPELLSRRAVARPGLQDLEDFLVSAWEASFLRRKHPT